MRRTRPCIPEWLEERRRALGIEQLLNFIRDDCISDATYLQIKAEDSSGNEHIFRTGGRLTESDLRAIISDEAEKGILYPAVLESIYITK